MAESNKRKSLEVEEDPETSAKRSRREEPSDGSAKIAPSFLGQQTIVTIVLKNEDSTERIPVHKNFICHYSPFFTAAFTGNFVEGQTQELELEDVPPGTFNIFVNWLYTQEIKDVDGKIPVQDRLYELWILADRFLIPKLQNKAMSYIRGVKTRYGPLSAPCAGWVYLNTAKGSPLRDCVADVLVSALLNQKPTHDYSWASNEMLLDTFKRIRCRLPDGTKIAVRPIGEFYINEDISDQR